MSIVAPLENAGYLSSERLPVPVFITVAEFITQITDEFLVADEYKAVRRSLGEVRQRNKGEIPTGEIELHGESTNILRADVEEEVQGCR